MGVVTEYDYSENESNNGNSDGWRRSLATDQAGADKPGKLGGVNFDSEGQVSYIIESDSDGPQVGEVLNDEHGSASVQVNGESSDVEPAQTTSSRARTTSGAACSASRTASLTSGGAHTSIGVPPRAVSTAFGWARTSISGQTRAPQFREGSLHALQVHEGPLRALRAHEQKAIMMHELYGRVLQGKDAAGQKVWVKSKSKSTAQQNCCIDQNCLVSRRLTRR